MGLGERGRSRQRVRRLTAPSASLPDFSGFHKVFRDHSGVEDTPEGDVRTGLLPVLRRRQLRIPDRREIFGKLDAGLEVVSATFVTPYPPGFPVLVPGQLFSREILSFIRDLDTPEIHGYQPDFGYRVYTDKAIEKSRPPEKPITNGHRPVISEPSEPAQAQA